MNNSVLIPGDLHGSRHDKNVAYCDEIQSLVRAGGFRDWNLPSQRYNLWQLMNQFSANQSLT